MWGRHVGAEQEWLQRLQALLAGRAAAARATSQVTAPAGAASGLCVHRTAQRMPPPAAEPAAARRLLSATAISVKFKWQLSGTPVINAQQPMFMQSALPKRHFSWQ